MTSSRHGGWMLALASAMLTVVACGDDAVDDEGSGGSASTSTSVSGNGGATSTTTTGGQGPTTTGGGGSAACEVPTSVGDLQAWLAGGTYQNWTAESAIHGSTGPHFGQVLTFVNDELFDSLTAADATHPVCAASVKELYGQSGNTVRGYAVMVKVTDGQGGDTWYWYEDFDGSVVAEGVGISTCTGCHSAGPDFFRSPFPLQ